MPTTNTHKPPAHTTAWKKIRSHLRFANKVPKPWHNTTAVPNTHHVTVRQPTDPVIQTRTTAEHTCFATQQNTPTPPHHTHLTYHLRTLKKKTSTKSKNRGLTNTQNKKIRVPPTDPYRSTTSCTTRRNSEPLNGILATRLPQAYPIGSKVTTLNDRPLKYQSVLTSPFTL